MKSLVASLFGAVLGLAVLLGIEGARPRPRLVVHTLAIGQDVQSDLACIPGPDGKCRCGPGCTCLQCPDPRHRPLPRRAFVQTFGEAKVGGYVSPAGEEIQCALPEEFHLKNRGGSDGAGLCVWASLQHSSIWSHARGTEHIFEWHFDKPGGGWPQRVDKDIPACAAASGYPAPAYLQAEDRDNRTLLQLACKTGRMPGITYGYSPTGRYNGQKIAHMTSLCHAGSKWYGVLDNNYPRTIEWMDPDTFLSVHNSGGQGWMVVFLTPPPPPVPHN